MKRARSGLAKIVLLALVSVLLGGAADACEKCKEKAGDSCEDGCLLPDGARAQ